MTAWQTDSGAVIPAPVGGVAGSLPLLLWGAMGESVAFGATLPGPGVLQSETLTYLKGLEEED